MIACEPASVSVWVCIKAHSAAVTLHSPLTFYCEHKIKLKYGFISGCSVLKGVSLTVRFILNVIHIILDCPTHTKFAFPKARNHKISSG